MDHLKLSRYSGYFETTRLFHSAAVLIVSYETLTWYCDLHMNQNILFILQTETEICICMGLKAKRAAKRERKGLEKKFIYRCATCVLKWNFARAMGKDQVSQEMEEEDAD